MTWDTRSIEARTLLNPAFCSVLIWQAAKGRANGSSLLSVEEAFVVLPLVLPSATRAALPATVSTSLPVWLSDHPLEQRRLPQRARALVPFSRAALLFGAAHELFVFEQGCVKHESGKSKKLKTHFEKSTEEARHCFSRAEFIGRWFQKTGSATTVMALLGVRP